MEPAELFHEVFAEEYSQIADEFQGNHLDICEEHLKRLKAPLINYMLFAKDIDKAEATKIQTIFEIGAQVSIFKEDVKSFGFYMTMLKSHFPAYVNDIDKSTVKSKLYGLHLMHLLSQKKIGEFYSNLELFQVDDINLDNLCKNTWVHYPLCVADYLLTGNTGMVYELMRNRPSESFTVFFPDLLRIIREQNADAFQAAMEHIPFTDIRRALLFQNNRDFSSYIQNKKNWTVGSDNRVVFKNSQITDLKTDVSDAFDKTTVVIKELNKTL